MIQTDSNKSSLKAIKERDLKQKEEALKSKCVVIANDKFGEEEIKKLSNANKGIWFLPIMDEKEEIECLALMKPIDRHILSYASTKIEDEGLYAFLEQCMRECFLAAIQPDGTVVTDANSSDIITNDEYFIPAAMKFNKILENKKAAFLKR